ncbi:MAG: pyruvate dehydrogenase complex dihydrolipoamide acetyltransferase [Alphaproteobacteria bacterium]|nr:pyruvate dehydrogenase complex dihydrolipoamide acetyltransferase [Alphaproteobacteria bacterium]
MSTQILMPALSPTMEEGTLTKWLVKEGDTVKAGDVIAEIETDKATMEVEAVDEGKLAQILVKAGTENVKVNTPIAVLLEEGEVATALRSNGAGQGAKAAPVIGVGAAEKLAPRAPEAGARPTPPSTEHRIFASPLARRIASEKGIDLAHLKGTGPHGRIVKADVENAGPAKPGQAKAPPARQASAQRPGATPSSIPDARLFFKEDSYKFVPHDSIRRTIARRLTASKRDIPHYYLTIDCQLDRTLEARAALNAKSPKDGPGAYRLSVNDFIVKAAAAALIEVPGVNASWTDDGLLMHAHADIGVAVALDFGLITPIVFAAEEKGLRRISGEVKDLAARARAKKLKPQEFEGGTFAVSNLGMYGIRNFTAVINPPHAAILAVGAGEERAIVRGGAIKTANMMTVQLSCDHRVIDGALGAQWLEVFKACIENPAEMLL